jgi:hypothetical protein
VHALKTVTFVYDSREDRVLAAINAGLPEAWSCWLTRRVVLALLERAAEFVAQTSVLAQRAPAELRGESVAFERDAAIASTAKSMSQTPPDVLKSSVTGAELAERLTISKRQDRFQLEIHGRGAEGAAGLMTRAELQRILQMLQAAVAKAAWPAAPAQSPAAPVAGTTTAKPVRH